MKKFLSLLCALLLLSGCRSHVVDLTVVSTRFIEVDGVDVESLPQKKDIVGESWGTMILFIPISQPKLSEAVDDALNKGNGDLMIDASVYRTGWTAILFARGSIEVTGTVVNTREAASMQKISDTQEVSQ